MRLTREQRSRISDHRQQKTKVTESAASRSSSLLLLLLSMTSGEPVDGDKLLLNAYNSKLDALASPNNYYFFEFPIGEGYNDDYLLLDRYEHLAPKCGNGSPYSFAFKRGTDEHVNKLIVELEGGPACWKENEADDLSTRTPGTCCGFRRQAPWYDYLKNRQPDVVSRNYFPPLGTCTGITSGFTKEAADILFGYGTDIPIPLREKGINGTEEWWETLGGNYDGSNVQDWSYLFLPHCTLDWHLGHQPYPQPTGCGRNNANLYHRGGTNLQAVINWTTTHFSNGLDALVITSGGSIGGCNDPKNPMAYTSSIAPMIFADGVIQKQQQRQSPSSILTTIEASNLWNNQLPSHDEMMLRWNARDLIPGGSILSTAESLIAGDSSSKNNIVKYAWFASEKGKVNSTTNEESIWLSKLKREKPASFYVYTPDLYADVSQSSTCPRFTFPDVASTDEVVDVSRFFRSLVAQMSWSRSNKDVEERKVRKKEKKDDTSLDENENSTRLTFFSLVIILGSLLALSYVVYFVAKRKRKEYNKSKPPSPYNLWLTALTKYPCTSLLISLLIPITLSCIAATRGGLTVNLDFDMYLNISSEIEDTARAYTMAQDTQMETLEQEAQNCAALNDDPIKEFQGRNRRSLFAEEEEMVLNSFGIEESSFAVNFQRTEQTDFHHPFVEGGEGRKLNTLLAYTKYKITLIYQNRNGGNVFEPEVLEQIREFERDILFFKDCFKVCMPFDTEITSFFPNDGPIVDDIEDVLQSFSEDNGGAVLKMDQYFGPGNLASNVTKTMIYLRDVGDGYKTADEFLKSLHRDFLWKIDQEKPYKYPDLIVTWSNPRMESEEARDALHHDALWSAGSLIFISLMIFLKVRNAFVCLSGMLGLVLAFSTAYYWVAWHFDIQQITLLHVSGLFVMLGIGADDIFLMVDSFEHTKLETKYNQSTDENSDAENRLSNEMQEGGDSQNVLEIVRKRMKSAYSIAGSMMLVSSMTTAVCFFSNAFGVLVVIQQFGIYMGMVVLINYVHVMTILPSAMMVSELYIQPWWARSRTRDKSWRPFLGALFVKDNSPSATDPDQHESSSHANEENAATFGESEETPKTDGTAFPYSGAATVSDSNGSIDETRKSDASIVFEENRGKQMERTAYWVKSCFRHNCIQNNLNLDANTGASDTIPANQNEDSSKRPDLPGPTTQSQSRSILRASACLPTEKNNTQDKKTQEMDHSNAQSVPHSGIEVKVPTLVENDLTFLDNDDSVTYERAPYANESTVMEISRMNRMDRWLVSQYTPCLGSRYKLVVFVAVVLSIILGSLGIASFQMSEGTIVLFSDKYNLGRVQTVTNAYYSKDIQKRIQITGFDYGLSSNSFADPGSGESGSSGPPENPLLANGDINFGSGSSSSGNSGGDTGTQQGLNPMGGSASGDGNDTPSSESSNLGGNSPGNGGASNPNLEEEQTPGNDSGDLDSEQQESGTTSPGNDGDNNSESEEQNGGIDSSLPGSENSGNSDSNSSSNGGNMEPTRQPGTLSPIGTQSPTETAAPTEMHSQSPTEMPSVYAPKETYSESPTEMPTTTVLPTILSTVSASLTASTAPTQTTIQRPPGQPATETPTQVPPPVKPLIGGSSGGSSSGSSGLPEGSLGLTISGPGQAPAPTPVTISRRDAIVVRFIWGIELDDDSSGLWVIKDHDGAAQSKLVSSSSPSFDLSEPNVQEWLYKVVRMARNETKLYIQPDYWTWIERFREFVLFQGETFPVPKHLFVGYLQLLKSRSNDFKRLIEREIGTQAAGLYGNFTFTSITFKADMLTSETSISTSSLKKWSSFVDKVNEKKPDKVAKVVAQSRVFLDAYRAEQTIDSTVDTWFVANGLCLLIILAFTQNMLLTVMVMVTLALIFLCLGGLLFFMFSLPFGPVEALGVSIFIGMSANYSLHVVHAFHRSPSDDHHAKMADVIFGVGSPIVASALSTIGASVFLFACRTFVFVELGILICSINAMALLFSMGFLLAWLKMIGPLPCDDADEAEMRTHNCQDDDTAYRHRRHYWDLSALTIGFCRWCAIWLQGRKNEVGSLQASEHSTSTPEFSA